MFCTKLCSRKGTGRKGSGKKGAGTKGTGRQVIPVEKGTGKRRNCYKTTGKEVSGRKGTRTKCVENVTVEKVLVKIRGGRR